MSIDDLSDTILAKSDQLNADDLIGASKTIIVSGVARYQENGASCFSINYEGDCGRPFKPCKTVRRVILHAWGKDGSKWVGKSMTLYCDPTAKWGGKEVGGVRISHMSDIESRIILNLSTAKGVKKKITIEILHPQQKATWDDEKLNKQLVNAEKAILAGSTTNEQVITKLEKAGLLTDIQKQRIRDIKQPEPVSSSEINISDDDFNE